MPPKKEACPHCGRKCTVNNWKTHVDSCLQKLQGIVRPSLRFVLAPPDSGYTNDANPCGTCGRKSEYRLIRCPVTNALCAPCASWGDPNERHKPHFTLDDRRSEKNSQAQELRAISGSRIVAPRGADRVDWSLVIDEASGGTLEDRAREFVVDADDESWRSQTCSGEVHASVTQLSVELFGDAAADKTEALMARLRVLKRRDRPRTYSGIKYYQFTQSMETLSKAPDPMFSDLPAATSILVGSSVQASVLVSGNSAVRACRPQMRRQAQGARCRTLLAAAAKRAFLNDGDKMLALLELNKRRVGVVSLGGQREGGRAWRSRWGHEGDASFGLNCRSSGLQILLDRGARVYRTASLDEDTLAGCNYGTKSQLDALLQAFNRKDDSENLVGQNMVSLPYTRPQARDFSEALGSLKRGDVVMVHVAVDATRVIELGPVRGGESLDADLATVYHAFGSRFDPDVYAQRGPKSVEGFVQRLLKPGECSGILMSGQDMGGILRRFGETQWVVIGRDCVDHPLDAEICTALDRTLARRVLDYDWTTADVPQDNWTGNKQMRHDNLVKVMTRADDAFRTYKVVFAPFRAALDDDEADTAAVLRACYDRLKQGCETMGAERFMAKVRTEFQANHADDIARELLRPRKVEIISVNIHDDAAEPERRVVNVERRGLDDLKDALRARLATRVAQPRDLPASELDAVLDAKVAVLPPGALASISGALDGDAPRTRPQPKKEAFDNDLAEALPKAGPPKSRSPRGSMTRLTPMEQLDDMGFKNERQNQKALRACGGDVNRAVEWIMADNSTSAANTRGRGRGDDI